jgi:GntR family transcriptional regulator
MKFRIVAGSSTSIYRQIADQVARFVSTGELAVGEPLPSIRGLAKELLINPNTVVKAYSDLVRDGIVETQAGRGFFVAKRRQIYSKSERLRRLDEAIQALVNLAVSLDLSLDEVSQRTLDALQSAYKTIPPKQ